VPYPAGRKHHRPLRPVSAQPARATRSAETMAAYAAETLEDRLAGRRPSRARALLVAVTAGAVVTVLTYKALRSGPSG